MEATWSENDRLWNGRDLFRHSYWRRVCCRRWVERDRGLMANNGELASLRHDDEIGWNDNQFCSPVLDFKLAERPDPVFKPSPPIGKRG